MIKHRLIVDQDGTGERIDAWLSASVRSLSRSYVHELIAQERVQVDGKWVKPAFRLLIGQVVDVEVPDPEPMGVRPEKIDLNIAYEDEWLIVVDKPQGMVVHPAPGHAGGTLVNALLDYCQGNLSDLNGVIRPGIVHRIDKDTSGLLLVVKNNIIHEDIADKIRRHEIQRTYQAIVHGQMPAEAGTIDAPIGRDPGNRQRMAVVAEGKPSITHFKVLERYAKASWVEARLETGRTHQIRVHFQYTGHPIVGDPVYAAGRKDFGLAGQALHACRLTFEHPVSHRMVEVTSPLPDWFRHLQEQLK